MKRRKTSAAVKLILLLGAAGAAVVGREFCHYMAHIPKITPQNITASLNKDEGTDISVDALASFETVKEKRITGAEWADGQTGGIEIAADRQSLTVWKTGELRVTVTACGEVSEWRSAVCTVTVKEPEG